MDLYRSDSEETRKDALALSLTLVWTLTAG